ncbi:MULTISPECIES: NAD(P)/FAD-dependent oxidoreductase [unclassified Cupriavidus]|uniref:NAD(P)/FAD-dependent oxidoreductase n=1 Tax=Cupriavidus sp. H19C3 TaxID=3241603 RepID=UPI003BF78A40
MAELVIIGASYAGTQLALAARAGGFAGGITMIGDETVAPYQRPPLSKAFLREDIEAASLQLQSPERFAEERIELRTGIAALGIDRAAQTVLLSDGMRARYDHLALTTGARCRRLACPGAEFRHVYYLRSLADARAIKAGAAQAKRAVVIGGGFIGLEVAASLRAQGLEVAVVELQHRLLQRAVPALISDFLRGAHEAQGVRFHLGIGVRRLHGDAGGDVSGVELDNGEILPATLVVAGLGVVPNVELAEQCGLAVDNGIVVDRFARTSDPRIVAAGDCAAYPNPWLNGTFHAPGEAAVRPVRVESIQSANDLARVAAATIVGQPAPYDAVPWFWSDQYGYKLQMAGCSHGHDEVIVRGEVAAGKFTAVYLRNGVMIGADSVNRPQDHMAARRLVAATVRPGAAALSDETVALKALLPA